MIGIATAVLFIVDLYLCFLISLFWTMELVNLLPVLLGAVPGEASPLGWAMQQDTQHDG